MLAVPGPDVKVTRRYRPVPVRLRDKSDDPEPRSTMRDDEVAPSKTVTVSVDRRYVLPKLTYAMFPAPASMRYEQDWLPAYMPRLTQVPG